MMICLSGQHEMTVDFSGFRNFFTLNFIKKPIYNAYVLTAKLKDTVVDCHTQQDNLDILATKDDAENYAILLSYAAKYFDENLPRVEDCLQLQKLSGNYKVKIWQIDENHTNPYNLAKSNGWGDVFNEEQIKILQNEGNLAPVQEYTATFDGNGEIPLSFSDNALLLVELERID
jgi:beta-xylosidase